MSINCLVYYVLVPAYRGRAHDALFVRVSPLDGVVKMAGNNRKQRWLRFLISLALYRPEIWVVLQRQRLFQLMGAFFGEDSNVGLVRGSVVFTNSTLVGNINCKVVFPLLMHSANMLG